MSERKWCDFISYSAGLPMVVIRVYPDCRVQEAIVEAAACFEARLAEKMALYRDAIGSQGKLIPTERRIEQEIYLWRTCSQPSLQNPTS